MKTTFNASLRKRTHSVVQQVSNRYVQQISNRYHCPAGPIGSKGEPGVYKYSIQAEISCNEYLYSHEDEIVNVDVAMLLAKVNFNSFCRSFYEKFNNESKFSLEDCTRNRMFDYCSNETLSRYSDSCETYIAAPTIQKAINWLKHYHNIYIDIKTHFMPNVECHMTPRYKIEIQYISDNKLNFIGIENSEELGVLYFSHIDAANAALKYCIENLIIKAGRADVPLPKTAISA